TLKHRWMSIITKAGDKRKPSPRRQRDPVRPHAGGVRTPDGERRAVHRGDRRGDAVAYQHHAVSDNHAGRLGKAGQRLLVAAAGVVEHHKRVDGRMGHEHPTAHRVEGSVVETVVRAGWDRDEASRAQHWQRPYARAGSATW